MGYTEFLVGLNARHASDLPTAIADLEDASTVLLDRWRRRDDQRAGTVSQKAMSILDFISSELLREEVERKGHQAYVGSLFAERMNALCGCGVTGVSLSDQIEMVTAGPGEGRIAAHLGARVELPLHRLLNKIKHRNPRLMNFRVEDGRHIFLICPEHTQGGAEGIYEFDVVEFCERCRVAASSL